MSQMFEDGRQLAEEGMTAALMHAQRKTPQWGEQAVGLLNQFIAEHDEPFFIEQARAWAEAQGLPDPPDKRAWGAIARLFQKEGRIMPLGYASMSSKKAHNAPKMQWRRHA